MCHGFRLSWAILLRWSSKSLAAYSAGPPSKMSPRWMPSRSVRVAGLQVAQGGRLPLMSGISNPAAHVGRTSLGASETVAIVPVSSFGHGGMTWSHDGRFGALWPPASPARARRR